MANRLKIIRKAKKITQQEVASYIGISQNTYSYWESGRVKIDNESLLKLSQFFGVSSDFLLGRRYRMTTPPETWKYGYDEDYENANQYEKVYLEYKFGNIQYIDDDISLDDAELFAVLESVRSRPEMRMLFSTLKDATKEDVERTVKIIEALKNNNG